jgi:mRNA interferase MazF
MHIDLTETQNIIDATKEQIFLQGKTHTGNRAKPKRGQVFYCHLGVGVGSEFQKRRPCVVLSNTTSNLYTSIVIVAPITHTEKKYPAFVPIENKLNANNEIILSGFVDLSSLRAVSSYRLSGHICKLSGNELNLIDTAIARHLDIMRHYDAIINVAEDKDKHIATFSSVLNKLKDITETKTNQELVDVVEKLFSKI